MRIRALLCLAVLATLLPLTQVNAAGVDGPRFDDATTRLIAEGVKDISVVVQYATPPTTADGETLLEAGFLPGSLVRYQVVPAISGVAPASAIKSLSTNPRITFIEHDATIPYTLDRATKAGRAQQIWDATYKLSGEDQTGGFTGRGIGVAIVDSGVDATHPDLIWKPLAEAQGVEPKTIANYKMVGRESTELTNIEPVGPFLEANQLATDVPHSDNTGGHGTNVAGIVGGNGAASGGRFKGAAPGANLIGYGAGEALVVTMGLAALDHIHLHHDELGIRVVNNSWGGAGEWDPDRAITQAVRRLVNEDGLVVVFAAGNSGGTGDDIQTSVWGNIPEVIQVANYYDRSGWLNESSSRGRRDREDTWPDVAAPGTQIIGANATGGPVSVFATSQDALVDESDLFVGGGMQEEPTVVPAPLPTTVGDDQVLVGNYASFSGTSMAAPFTSGVAALILEANPDLDPFEVRDILRETANVIPGRSYANDGYAMGRGMIDAAEAVAVALRMREGLSIGEALHAAYVDTSTEPYKLNTGEPTKLEITSPAEGEQVQTTLDVEGVLTEGPKTDNSIPLYPEIAQSPAVEGNAYIYAAGAVNPFPNDPILVPGEPVGMAGRGIHSNESAVVLAEGQASRHVVTQGDTVIADLPTVLAVDGSVGGGANGYRSDTDWTVPSDALGHYVLSVFVTVNGTEYLAATRHFDVGAPGTGTAPTAGVSAPTLPVSTNIGAQSTILSEGFEEAAPAGWTTEQNSPAGPGLLTEWRWMGEATATWAGSHSGNGWFGANSPASQVLELYTDSADVSLLSPVIDLSGMSTASAQYWRGGASESGADFLEVYVDPEGPAEPVLLESLSGLLLLDTTGTWQESPRFNLSPFIGQQVRLRFRFSSDAFSFGPNFPGWSIDDVTVSGDTGAAEATLHATPSSGVAPLETTFEYGFGGAAASFELGFGDGSSHTATSPGTVKHTYGVGTHNATLTVRDAGGAVLGTDQTTVTVGEDDIVQLRLVAANGATAWTTVPRSETGAFAHSFDLAGVPAGPATVEARYIKGSRTMHTSVNVEVVEPVVEPTGPVANDDTASATTNKTATIDVLANDDLGDATVTVTAGNASTQGGVVSVQKDGTVRYRSASRFTGTDTFSYTITDANGNADQATVTVAVTCRAVLCA